MTATLSILGRLRRRRRPLPQPSAERLAAHNAEHPELHGYPFVIIGCGRCSLGILRPDLPRCGRPLWRCGVCRWRGHLARDEHGRLVQ